MKNSPDFLEIWTRSGWSDFRRLSIWTSLRIRPRGYYQVRSIVRIVFWFSYFYFALDFLDWSLA
jgi:hypothetical protein